MKTVEMKAERRTSVGSRASRRLRHEGRLPGVLCGKGVESIAVHVSARDFQNARKQHARIVMLALDGASEPAVIHEVYHDPLGHDASHVDFQRVNLSERIEIGVGIKTKGPSKGELDGGILLVQADTVRVRCLPLEIPDFIEVDIRPLEIHDSLHVKDLVMPAGVERAGEPDELVLSIVEKRELVVEAPAAAEGEAAPAEPELIAKAPKEEAEGEGEAAPAK